MAIIKQYHPDTQTTYVYESTYYWDADKQQSRSKRKLIGKVDPKTGETVPTGKRGPKTKRPNAGAAVQAAPAEGTAGDETIPYRTYRESQQRIADLTLALAEKEKENKALRKRNEDLSRTLNDVVSKITGLAAGLRKVQDSSPQ